MRGIREQIKISHCVILCLILGCSLRFVGLTRGDSSFVIDGASQSERAFYHFHPDETALIQAALDPIDPFAPKITSYGMLPIYLLKGVLEFNSIIFGRGLYKPELTRWGTICIFHRSYPISTGFLSDPVSGLVIGCSVVQ